MSNTLESQANLLSYSDFVLHEFNTSKYYDYILTCFEPIGKVHGGIGTYTRLILENSGPARVLLISGTLEHSFYEDFITKYPNVSVAVIERDTHVGRNNVNFIGDVYNKFSFNIMRYLISIQKGGTKFRSVEFPDYGAEGFFSIRAAKAGILAIDSFVRLHSPNFMLFEDNRNTSLEYQDYHIEMAAYELAALQEANFILYGNDAMLKHVFDIAEDQYKVKISKKKATKLPHPWPTTSPRPPSTVSRIIRSGREFNNSKINISLIGRLETRKGSVRFAKNISDAVSKGILQPESLKIHFFGADTQAPGVPSIRAIVEDILTASGVETVFWGRLNQNILDEHVQACDGIVFPSLFENYPNALLEVLPHTMPILVSKSGGMEEISSDFDNVASYDVNDEQALAKFIHHVGERKKIFLGISADSTEIEERGRARYQDIAKYQNLKIRQFFENKIKNTPDIAPPAYLSGTCSVIIPHFRDFKHLRECINSIKFQLNRNDQVIVVDDFSGPDYVNEQAEFVNWLDQQFSGSGVSPIFIESTENRGPGHARNRGVEFSKSDYIIFLDCDDLLATDAIARMRTYLDRNSGIQAASGIMKTFGIENHYWCPKDGIKDLIIFKNVSHSGFIIRKESFLKIRFSDDRLNHYEDWEFMMRFILSDGSFNVIPWVTYFYRVLPSPTSRNRANAHFTGFSQIQIIEKSLAFASSRGIPLSPMLLSRLVGQASGLGGQIKHPDSFQPSAVERPAKSITHKGAIGFIGHYAIDTVKFDDNRLVITGWIAGNTDSISFSFGGSESGNIMNHTKSERADVVKHLEMIDSDKIAYGFNLFLPLDDIQLAGDKASIFVRDGIDFFRFFDLEQITSLVLR